MKIKTDVFICYDSSPTSWGDPDRNSTYTFYCNDNFSISYMQDITEPTVSQNILLLFRSAVFTQISSRNYQCIVFWWQDSGITFIWSYLSRFIHPTESSFSHRGLWCKLNPRNTTVQSVCFLWIRTLTGRREQDFLSAGFS